MAEAKKIVDLAAFLEIEAQNAEKHEFWNGELVLMAGGSIPHNMLSGNTYHSLRNELKNRCIVLNSDQKVFFEQLNHFVYPDVSVVCGEINEYENTQAITNPILIVEVLSENTAAYDRGEKFRKYRSLPSFKEYILIDQHQPIVDALYRENDQFWRMQTIIGLDKQLPIYSLGISLSMASIYENVPGLSTPQLNIEL